MAQVDPVLLLVGCCSLQLKFSLFETQDDTLHWHLENQPLSYQSTDNFSYQSTDNLQTFKVAIDITFHVLMIK